MTYKVCLPTAGIGSRLEEITKLVNKSLVDVAYKPVISHIIEKFPRSCKFVIPLGYKGILVKEYLELVHPNLYFEFINIDPYQGNNSSLGYTLLSSKKLLQEPFVFIPCDTLIENEIPSPSVDWMAYSDLKQKSQYRTLNIVDECVNNINEKSKNYSINDFVYTGLSGIFNFEKFWFAMENGSKNASSIGEVYGMRSLIQNGLEVNAIKMNWYDIGNKDALLKTRKKYQKEKLPTVLEKEKEKIWFVENKVIKFNEDQEFISNRVKRAYTLSEFIPKMIANNNNMYMYLKEEGDVLSNIIDINLFKKFLVLSKQFWKKFNLSQNKKDEFIKKSNIFYKHKTVDRVKNFFKLFNIRDSKLIINNVETPSLNNLLSKLDWDYISSGVPVRFHGDFHFENIIYNKEIDQFFFLDWRQDFGGIIEYGDIYYDLAKLYHGIIINHKIIADNNFSVNWEGDKSSFDFLRKNSLVECEIYFKEWLQVNNFDFNKVEIITALIFLNISPLHHYPYSQLLFLLGKYMLNQNIVKNEK